MGVEYYHGKAIPVFESTVCHNCILYGLSMNENERSYNLYEISSSPMRLRFRFTVQRGTILELEKSIDNEIGVHYISPDGNDEGFVALPL